MTKCWHCGADMPDGKVCNTCKKESPSDNGIEVQYRDFKVTEMLDIRIPSQTPHRRDKEKTPPPPQEKEADRQTSEKNPHPARSVPFLIATVITVIAGFLFFLLYRFVMHR